MMKQHVCHLQAPHPTRSAADLRRAVLWLITGALICLLLLVGISSPARADSVTIKGVQVVWPEGVTAPDQTSVAFYFRQPGTTSNLWDLRIWSLTKDNNYFYETNKTLSTDEFNVIINRDYNVSTQYDYDVVKFDPVDENGIIKIYLSIRYVENLDVTLNWQDYNDLWEKRPSIDDFKVTLWKCSNWNTVIGELEVGQPDITKSSDNAWLLSWKNLHLKPSEFSYSSMFLTWTAAGEEAYYLSQYKSYNPTLPVKK